MNSMCPASFSSGPCTDDTMAFNASALAREQTECLLAGCQDIASHAQKVGVPVGMTDLVSTMLKDML